MTVLEILSNKLVGKFISQFTLGDTWNLFFGDCYIVAQNVASEDEGRLSQLYNDQFSWFKDSVNRENIAKCAIVSACMRRMVTGIKLKKSGDLMIAFEGDIKLIIPTDESTVDWQWCLNNSGKTPYEDYLVACFWQGEIRQKENQD